MWSKFMRLTQDILHFTQNRPSEMPANVLTKILFVCMGNICRSPMAEGAFRRMLEDVGLADKIYIDSAGTHSYHEGSTPDMRGQAVAQSRGVDLKAIRARRIVDADFATFDYLLAMDRDNYEYLLTLCRQPEHREKIQLFLDYAPGLAEREVPDPYYGGLSGFERVMDLVEEGAEGLLLHIRERFRI
jgi:protein-tyrosine phosphatase